MLDRFMFDVLRRIDIAVIFTKLNLVQIVLPILCHLLSQYIHYDKRINTCSKLSERLTSDMQTSAEVNIIKHTIARS